MQVVSQRRERLVLLEPRPRRADQGPDDAQKRQHLMHFWELSDHHNIIDYINDSYL